MKKIMNLKNIGLILTIVLVSILTFSTKEAKAAGTVTWNGPSSITIRETIKNIANPIVATNKFDAGNFAFGNWEATATVTFAKTDTITNNQVTKTAVLSFADAPITRPGDYDLWISSDGLEQDCMYIESGETPWGYFDDDPSMDSFYYKVTVSVRNVVDANDVPTGNFTASIILEHRTDEDPVTGEDQWEKVSPQSGVLYADYNKKASPNAFGHIEISKTVKGIGADTNKYFPVTITIDNYLPETCDTVDMILDADDYVYPVTGLDATTPLGNNPTTITTGTATTIYLKHGQTAIVGSVTKSGGGTFDAIPLGDFSYYPPEDHMGKGVYYSVSEDPDDYTGQVTIAAYGSEIYDITSAAGIAVSPGTNEIGFINTKEMSPVTGLIFTILPYMILVGIGVGGVLLFRYSKTKKSKS